MKKKILDEQIEYYRARAQEYDASISSAAELFHPATSMLFELGKFDQILELACGTGFWTETLLGMGGTITAVDAAPEMLAIARNRLSEDRIQYQQIDLFQWSPQKEYDLVFFANWLSHIPPSVLDDFLGKVRDAVRPGGQIAIVDQHAPSEADAQVAKEDIYATRPLEDGRQFTIVKAFYEVDELQEKLGNLGFETAVSKFADVFFFFSGRKVR